MKKQTIIIALIAVILGAVPAWAGDTLYVDLDGIDTAFPDLTDAQRQELKDLIVADIQANFNVAGVDITVTTDPTADADRTVHINDDMGTHTRSDGSTGHHYGEWTHGSDEANVHLDNFTDRHGDDYKDDAGNWDLDKLRKGIGRTAAHEIAHSYSVGHNDDGDSPTKMTEGGLVSSETRANTEWIFDDHTADVMNENLGKDPCETTTDYDEEYIEPVFTWPPLFPNPDWDPSDPDSDPFNDLDEYGNFDARLFIEGMLVEAFDLGWYGRDTDNGLEDGNPDFDFIYKASMAEPTPPEFLTFFEDAHATTQFVLRGRMGTEWEGIWFPMCEAELIPSDFVVTPEGEDIFRMLAIMWDIDGDGTSDIAVMLDSNMLYPWGAEFNGWRINRVWPCLGDLDHDYDIDLSDLAQLLSNYGTEYGAVFEDGDLDGDRDVDLSDLAALLAVYGTTCFPDPYCVPPGDDCWYTQFGAARADFVDDPIPADFFEPGSDPFDGVIALAGETEFIDTVLERLGEMCFEPPDPSTAEVPIQLVELNLVSTEPITVMIMGEPVLWDVLVDLSAYPVDPGVLSATKTHENGGTFTAEFFAQLIYTFIRVDPPHDVCIWDTGMLGIPPLLMQTVGESPWSTDEMYEVCTFDGYAAGVTEVVPGEPCCVEVCFTSVGTTQFWQCVRPPNCPECP